MTNSGERRKHQRSTVPLHVDLRLKCGVLIEGRALNVSLCGMLVETERSLPKGTRVRVCMFHKNFPLEHITCSGVVTRLDSWGMAIEFDELPPLYKEVLNRHIETGVVEENLVTA